MIDRSKKIATYPDWTNDLPIDRMSQYKWDALPLRQRGLLQLTITIYITTHNVRLLQTRNLHMPYSWKLEPVLQRVSYYIHIFISQSLHNWDESINCMTDRSKFTMLFQSGKVIETILHNLLQWPPMHAEYSCCIGTVNSGVCFGSVGRPYILHLAKT